jgi:hypothetical protein
MKSSKSNAVKAAKGIGFSAAEKKSGFKKIAKSSPHSRISDGPRKSSTGGLNHAPGSKKG